MIATFFRTVWAILRKDLRVWVRNPATFGATFIPPLAFILIGGLNAAATGRSPVALVVEDHGAKANQIVQAFNNADVFRISNVDATQAKILLKNLDVVAIVTVPPNFTQSVEQHQNVAIDVAVNNLNLDYTNDIRRAVPDVITHFYQMQGNNSPVKIGINEQDLRQQDIQAFQFTVVPTIILLLMIAGLVTSGLGTAREWESRTIKELLLSPTTATAIITGKVLAGFASTFVLGVLVLGVGDLLGWTQPQGFYWLNALLIMALVALFSTGLGVALGALIQRIQAVIGLAINIALYLYFLAGGIAVLAFEPAILQKIGAYIPLTYGNHGLQMAVFYGSSDLFGRDVLVLGLCALATLALGVFSMRRGIAG